jgi:hypothetical protein
MTFEEAKKFKEGLEKPIFIEGGITFKAFVVPGNQEDFIKRYLPFAFPRVLLELKDEDAKNYSHNQVYIVCGLTTNNRGSLTPGFIQISK